MEAGNFIEGHLLGLVQETGGGNGKVEARRLAKIACGYGAWAADQAIPGGIEAVWAILLGQGAAVDAAC